MSENLIPKSLIRKGRLEADTWQRFEPADKHPLPADDGDWLVPLAVWQAHETELRARRHPAGVLLGPADAPGALGADGKVEARGLALIAVDFPAFTDGRGYSIAYTLRTRLGWVGELRAVGDVLIDTLYYQARAGFDAFALKAGQDAAEALKAFETFSVNYQQSYPKVL